MRISRIRLSDKGSCLRPREGAGTRLKSDEAECLVEILVGEACGPRVRSLVLTPQPLTEPMPGRRAVLHRPEEPEHLLPPDPPVDPALGDVGMGAS